MQAAPRSCAPERRPTTGKTLFIEAPKAAEQKHCASKGARTDPNTGDLNHANPTRAAGPLAHVPRQFVRGTLAMNRLSTILLMPRHPTIALLFLLALTSMTHADPDPIQGLQTAQERAFT